MSKDSLLELQAMFPRQKCVNAIDTFICHSDIGRKSVDHGNNVRIDCVVLKTPMGNTFCNDRYFSGSMLSSEIFDRYNRSYGVVSLISQLYQNSKNSLGREIVRGFTKNVIKITRSYFDNKIESNIINSRNLKFPPKDQFYARAFDPDLIRKEMRIKVRKRAERLFMRGGHPSRFDLSKNSNQRGLFVEACNSNGLTSIEEVLNEFDEFKHKSMAYESGIGLIYLLRRLTRPTNKKFYKAIEKSFQGGGLQ